MLHPSGNYVNLSRHISGNSSTSLAMRVATSQMILAARRSSEGLNQELQLALALHISPDFATMVNQTITLETAQF